MKFHERYFFIFIVLHLNVESRPTLAGPAWRDFNLLSPAVLRRDPSLHTNDDTHHIKSSHTLDSARASATPITTPHPLSLPILTGPEMNPT